MAMTTKSKDKKPIKYVDDDPENIKLSKKEFVAKRKKQKERDAYLKAQAAEFEANYDKEEPETPKLKEEEVTTVKVVKKVGKAGAKKA